MKSVSAPEALAPGRARSLLAPGYLLITDARDADYRVA